MKLFLTHFRVEDDYNFLGVFTTRELAEKACEDYLKENPYLTDDSGLDFDSDISEIEVDRKSNHFKKKSW